MLRAFAPIVLCLSLLSTASAQDATVSFTKRPPKMNVGDKLKASSSEQLSLKLELIPDGAEAKHFKTEELKTAKLSASVTKINKEGRPTELKVSVEELKKLTKENGKTATQKNPKSGQTFQVRCQGGQLSAVDDKGQALDAKGAKSLFKDLDKLLRLIAPSELKEFQALLTSKPLKLSQKLKLNEAQAKELFKNEAMNKGDLLLTLKSVGELHGFKTATFDLSVLNKDRPEETGAITLNLIGSLVITLEGCVPVSYSAKGLMTMTEKTLRGGKSMSMFASGTVLVKDSVIVQSAK